MDIGVFGTAIVIIFVSQILLTALVKKAWVKWLPTMVLGILMILCVFGYGLSGWTNWGFIILFAVFGVLLAGTGVAAVFGVLLRRLLKKK